MEATTKEIGSQLSMLLKKWLVTLGLAENHATIISIALLIAGIIIIAFIADFITKKVLTAVVTRLVKKSKSKWDDIFAKKKVFGRIAHFAPALIIYFGINLVFVVESKWITIIQAGALIYIILITLLVIDSIINSAHAIYQSLPISRNRSIKGYIQVIKIIINFIGIIFILSLILNKEIGFFFAGLGAIAAVLMLVFKDSILGLVGGIQLSANDMVRPGDWIEMPSHGADGTVTDISLNTVKVQNWDKTITTIPTYALVSQSFSNWRGMEESGGRRIKRSINIDMNSVKFCTKQMTDKFRKIHYLKDYVETKEKELEQYNKENIIDNSIPVNGRRLTNIGTFRKYIEEFLKHHPRINNDMTFLVRHLQPSEKGLPIEIYVFSNDQEWANYEAIQADILDHIMAVIPEFELSVFQNPTGNDFKELK